MSGIPSGNDREFVANLQELCTSILSESSSRTVNETLLRNIESAVNANLISPRTSEKLQIPLQPLRDRQISTLTPQEKDSIHTVVQEVLTGLSQPAEEGSGSAASSGYGSAASAASSERISQAALLGRKKECQKALTKMFTEHQFGGLETKKLLFRNEFTMQGTPNLETLTPVPQDLSLQETMPILFREDHVSAQRGPDTSIVFQGRSFPPHPMTITKDHPENAQAVQALTEKLASMISPSQVDLRKPLSHAMLFFTTQHIQNNAFGPIRDALIPLEVDQFDDFMFHIEGIQVTFSPSPPNGFTIEADGSAAFVHKKDPQTSAVSFTVQGSLTCRVTAEGVCTIQNPVFSYKATLKKG